MQLKKKNIIIRIPKYFCVSEQQCSLPSDPEILWVLPSNPFKHLGLVPTANITCWHQPVNQASLNHALEEWCIGQTLPFSSKWGKTRDLRTHRVWGKANDNQGEAEDRSALETNSKFETYRKFRLPPWEVQRTLLCHGGTPNQIRETTNSKPTLTKKYLSSKPS